MRAAVIAAGLAAAAFAGVAFLASGPALPAGGALVVVHEGDSVATIAERLHRAGIVRSALFFRLSARLTSLDRRMQAGAFQFTEARALREVLAVLAAGSERREITVPEGLTVREVASLLSQHGYGPVEGFLCLVDDPDFLLAAGVPGSRLEGYLFPATYRFSPFMSPGEIFATMVRRFHERFDAERHRRAVGRGMNVDQVMTLASIIEKETAVPSERPVIAGVFTNRMRLGLPLQSDPTVIYAAPDFRGNLTRADLARPSPYNTYLTIGLPPGPIANPGLAAIDAALAPADTPYFYFVSRNDGSHAFSVTLDEHNRAVARYQRRPSR